MSEVTVRHEVALRHRVGALALDVEFTLREPWTVLFAPSGGGKTTVLRLIAGLEQPLAGHVLLRSTRPPMAESERALVDVAKGIFVPPHRRGVGMVAQRPALFPNRDVLGNVRYGVFSGRAKDEAGEVAGFVDEVMALCRVDHLRSKRPQELSGGERQRVALARTLAARHVGGLLLLDEPFTGLEAGLREELIASLGPWLRARGETVLMVTHDLGEVFAAGAQVVRMAEGRVVAQGPAAEVLAGERARLLGVLG